MKKRIIIISAISIFLLSSAGVALLFWHIFLRPNGNSCNYVITIDKNTNYSQIAAQVEQEEMVKNSWTFNVVAEILQYDTYFRKGKYSVKEGESNLDLIRRWRQGQHYPIKFTFNNIRLKEQLLEKVGDQFLFPNDSLQHLLNDAQFLSKYNLTPENVTSIFIPNTYEVYYDIDAEAFFHKMYSIYTDFWNQKRLARAKQIGFTPLEISIIASIVEEENHKAFEKPIIAGVYINRLNKNMLLQADPTVKYAVGDFTLKRILNEHLTIDSPYNTYRYLGLPPAPIRIPEASTLDSVLNYTQHHYIYMCAKEDFSGEHRFATTLREHNNNAKRYHQALNRNNIR